MKKIIALLLGIIMIFSFSGCFSLPEDYEDNNDVVNDSDEEETKKPKEEKGDAEDAKLVAEKIEEADLDIVSWDNVSAVCEKDGEYAIVSAEGEVSDNTFKLIDSLDDGYYAVSTEKSELSTEPESRNVYGVADIDGDIIVPEEYASIKYLNDRFFLVFTVTEITENKEDAILYLTENTFSLEPSEDDILYAGKWEIYDVEEEDIVPDVSGEYNPSVSVYENIICVDYDVYYKADGTELPEDAEVFDNGCYSVEDDDNITVYDENYEKLFEGENELFIYESADSSPDYFIADDADVSGYYLVDKKGKKVSEEIDGTISDVFFDKYIVVSQDGEYGLYDFDGEEIVACEYKDIESDGQFGIEIFALEAEDSITYIYSDGTEIAKAELNEDSIFDHMAIESSDGDEDVFFNLSTEEYDIKNALSLYELNWCVESKEDDDGAKRGITDVISGEKIIECKYGDVVVLGDYVVGSYGDGTYDFYEITVEY